MFSRQDYEALWATAVVGVCDECATMKPRMFQPKSARTLCKECRERESPETVPACKMNIPEPQNDPVASTKSADNTRDAILRHMFRD